MHTCDSVASQHEESEEGHYSVKHKRRGVPLTNRAQDITRTGHRNDGTQPGGDIPRERYSRERTYPGTQPGTQPADMSDSEEDNYDYIFRMVLVGDRR